MVNLEKGRYYTIPNKCIFIYSHMDYDNDLNVENIVYIDTCVYYTYDYLLKEDFSYSLIRESTTHEIEFLNECINHNDYAIDYDYLIDNQNNIYEVW